MRSLLGTARVWDLQGNELAVLHGHQSRVWSVEFSPDGQMLATASEDGTARVWDRRGNELAVLRGHQSTVNDAEFSLDGQMLVTASVDNTARVWDLQGNELAVLKGHKDQVIGVEFSPDGQMLATASFDGTARVWAVEGLDDMLARGCELLEDYLVENFEALESLTTCQDSVNFVAVASGLVKQGEELARQGDVEGAVAFVPESIRMKSRFGIGAGDKSTTASR